MVNKIFLNCSLYANEIEIPLMSEVPSLSASCIQEDVLIYEDAIYSGRILLMNREKNVSAVELYLNDNKIGEVNISYIEHGVTGEICFEELVEGIPKPFLLQCDLISIYIKIYYGDGTDEKLYTPYTLCVSKNSEDNENVEQILEELLQYDDDKINKWIFQKSVDAKNQEALLEGAIRDRSYKSIASYVQLLEQIVICYRQNIPYFKSMPKHKIDSVNEMRRFSEMRKISSQDFKWLTHHLEQLSVVQQTTAISYNGENYLPLNILSENKMVDYDIFENRVVLSFLSYVIDETRQLIGNLHRFRSEEEEIYKKLRKFTLEEYYAPIITVKRIQNDFINSLLIRLETMILSMDQLLRSYKDWLKCSTFLMKTLPRRTKIFQEVKSYKMIYDMIVKWFKFGDVDLKKEKMIFRVKTMDKLFEYYCLQQLLKMFWESGFEIEDAINDICFYGYSSVNDLYENEYDVANTYVLRRHDKIVTLYFQPVILSNGFQNGLELYRTTGRNVYYTPDYLIKVDNGKKIRYAILDAKYSERDNILKYYMKDCLLRYGTEIEAKGENSEIKMMWLLQGRIDNKSAFYFYNNSPNSRNNSKKKSYGIVSLNTKNNVRSRLMEEIMNYCG